MLPDEYAAFLENRGHRLVRAANTYWYNSERYFYTALLPHATLQVTTKQLDPVFSCQPFVFGARYYTETQAGKDSFLSVCTRRDYDLSALEHSARNQTRRGLEHCRVTQLTPTELFECGHVLNIETFVRQGRNGWMNPDRWREYCEALFRQAGFEAWGAFVGRRLAAFLVTVQIENVVTLLMHRSATELLPQRPNNALVFVVTQASLARPNVRMVSYGPESPNKPGLQMFKRNMGFVEWPMRQRLVIHPTLRPIRRQLVWAMRILARKSIRDRRLSRALHALDLVQQSG